MRGPNLVETIVAFGGTAPAEDAPRSANTAAIAGSPITIFFPDGRCIFLLRSRAEVRGARESPSHVESEEAPFIGLGAIGVEECFPLHPDRGVRATLAGVGLGRAE